MIAVLSPAKRLNENPVEPGQHSFPRLLDQAEQLAGVMRKKSGRQLQKLMNISPKLAALNVERYQGMEFPPQPGKEKQALLTFEGDVYQGLKADELTEDDLLFAQEHLRILSGLYGLLRPMDLIHPYRLEMGTSLKVRRKKNLYEFWDDQITRQLNEDLAQTGSPVLVNLASQEYFQAVQTPKIEGKLLNIHFKEERNDKLQVVSFFAKKARGMMARYIIENRINEPAALREFSMEGYGFREDLASESDWTFSRMS